MSKQSLVTVRYTVSQTFSIFGEPCEGSFDNTAVAGAYREELAQDIAETFYAGIATHSGSSAGAKADIPWLVGGESDMEKLRRRRFTEFKIERPS